MLRKVKLRRKKKCWGHGCPFSWSPCCETWLIFEIEALRCKKKKVKVKKNVWVMGYPVSWAPCCETWLIFEIEGKFAIVEKTGEWNQGFLFTGFVPTGWAPCCERTKSWVPYCKWTWNILSRTLGGSFTCVYTRGPWAVEYLAKLSRILVVFSKSFKAMILGFNFI